MRLSLGHAARVRWRGPAAAPEWCVRPGRPVCRRCACPSRSWRWRFRRGTGRSWWTSSRREGPSCLGDGRGQLATLRRVCGHAARHLRTPHHMHAQVVRALPAARARARQGRRLAGALTLCVRGAAAAAVAVRAGTPAAQTAPGRLFCAHTQVAEQLGDQVKILKVDVDENPVLSSQLRVRRGSGRGQRKQGRPSAPGSRSSQPWSLRSGPCCNPGPCTRRLRACPRWSSSPRTLAGQRCAPRGCSPPRKSSTSSTTSRAPRDAPA